MPQPTLLVLSQKDDPYLPMLDVIRDRARLVIGDSASALAEAAPEAEALLAWTVKRSELEALLPLAPQLRWMHVRWAGVDSLLFPALVESPVTLTNSRGVYSLALGEFVIAGALFFAKDIRGLLATQFAQRWDPFIMQELSGATMGIVGYGDIGRACGVRAKALGMRVLAYRRRPDLSAGDAATDEVFSGDNLNAMIAQCDYVVVALPLTPATRGLIGKAQIEAMKPSAVLMNVGRGPVIDEPALIEALDARSIRGAVLDVFSEEPLPPHSPLWNFDNVLLSPHCADNTPTWNQEAMKFFLENFDRFLTGAPLQNVVDKQQGY